MPVQNTSAPRTNDRPGQLIWQDCLVLFAVIVAMLVFGYTHGHNRIFWSDELMGWLVIREKTFSGMIHNWQAGVDSGSLFYMVCGRWWMDIFGPSEMSLRMFSASGIAASFVLLWMCARRFFSWQIVAVCLPFMYFANVTLNWQYFNGRMYGGFMAATALAALAFLKADPALPLTRRILLLTFCAHFFLMSSHILGPLYSGVFLAGLVVQDLWARTFRPKLYASAFAGWIVLLVSFKNILGTIGAGQQKYWTVRPTFGQFLLGFTVFGQRLAMVIVGMLLLALLAAAVRAARKDAPQAGSVPRTPLYFLLVCFLTVLVLAYAVSLVTTSIYFNRYLLPVLLGDALLMCELAFHIQRDLLRTAAMRYAAVAVALALFFSTFVRQFRGFYQYPEVDYTAEMLTKDPAGLPLVCTNVQTFAEMEFYRDKQALLLIPQGWPAGTTGAHEMDHWKTAGYYSSHILPTDSILQRFPQFLLADDPDSPWLPRYIGSDPHYIIASEGKFHGQNLWLVTRQSALTP